MPLPKPFAPDVTVIHEARLKADQPQVLVVETVTVPLPPDAGKELLVGDIEKGQGVPA